MAGLAVRKGASAVLEEPFELCGVKLVGANPQAVARRRRLDEPGVTERLAQTPDVDVHGLRRTARSLLAPQRERETLRAHRLIGMQQQHRQHATRLDAAQRHRTLRATNLKRAEDEKPHGSTLPARVGGICEIRRGVRGRH